MKQALAEVVLSSHLVQVKFLFSQAQKCSCVLQKFILFDQKLDQKLDATQMQLKCSLEVAQMEFRCSFNAAQMQLRFNFDSTLIQLRCNLDRTQMRLRYSLDTTQMQFRCSLDQNRCTLDAIYVQPRYFFCQGRAKKTFSVQWVGGWQD